MMGSYYLDGAGMSSSWWDSSRVRGEVIFFAKRVQGEVISFSNIDYREALALTCSLRTLFKGSTYLS